LRETGAAGVRDTARRWLDDGVYVLEVRPFGNHAAGGGEVDRSRLPEIGEALALELPDVRRFELDNGLKVWLAERHQAPVVQFQMVLDAGYAADPADAPGTASLALAMLDEGTAGRDALQISAELDRLGAQLATDSSLDASSVSLSALATRLDDSLALYADVIRNPTFPGHELARLKQQRLAQIEQEKSNPTSLALRTLGPLLYGEDHAYGVPLTGSGKRDAVAMLDVTDMQGFHRHWVRPDNATLVVVGDTDIAALRPLLEKHFGDWSPATGAAAPEKRLPQIAHTRNGRASTCATGPTPPRRP
jgi:zinc protease